VESTSPLQPGVLPRPINNPPRPPPRTQTSAIPPLQPCKPRPNLRRTYPMVRTPW